MDLALPRLSPDTEPLDERDRALVRAVQGGLPLVPRPYAAVAAAAGMSEAEVISRLRRLAERDVIRRLGVVVRHRELGYTANAMVVWDVPDDRVAGLGRCLAAYPFVTLCYRRPRRPPAWPYNLFCMIHGRSREGVLAQVEQLVRECGLDALPRAVLFSRRCFKQRGAWYGGDARDAG